MKNRKSFFIALAIAVVFGLSCVSALSGCTSKAEREEAKEKAAYASEYCRTIRHSSFTRLFKVESGIDAYGNSIPVIVLDEETSALLVSAVEAYNNSGDAKSAITVEGARTAFTEDLVDVLYCGSTGEDNEYFSLIEWLIEGAQLIDLNSGDMIMPCSNIVYLAGRDMEERLSQTRAYPWETERIEAYKATHDVEW